MTTLAHAFRHVVRAFADSECSGIALGEGDAVPAIAAVGTIASTVMASSTLAIPLAEGGLALGDIERLVVDSPSDLVDNDTWQLALILSPHKQTSVAICASLSPRAVQSQVVDTIIRGPSGLAGLNANSFAISAAVQHFVGHEAPDQILIVGTGATARSSVVGLRASFPHADFGAIGRSSTRTQRFVDEVGIAERVGDVKSFRPQLVIHATTVGERDDCAWLDVDLSGILQPGVRVLDLNQRTTELQRRSLASGCATMSGGLVQLLTNVLRVAILRPERLLETWDGPMAGDLCGIEWWAGELGDREYTQL